MLNKKWFLISTYFKNIILEEYVIPFIYNSVMHGGC